VSDDAVPRARSGTLSPVPTPDTPVLLQFGIPGGPELIIILLIFLVFAVVGVVAVGGLALAYLVVIRDDEGGDGEEDERGVEEDGTEAREATGDDGTDP